MTRRGILAAALSALVKPLVGDSVGASVFYGGGDGPVVPVSAGVAVTMYYRTIGDRA